MKTRHFSNTPSRSKAQWRKEAGDALGRLSLDQLQTVRSRFSYPLRVKDFNTRMCKTLLQLIAEVESETDRTVADS